MTKSYILYSLVRHGQLEKITFDQPLSGITG